jgi:osmotically-inducible protein OsmY
MKIFLALITVAPLLLSGCSTVATGTAEATGLSLWHDRRTSKALAIDESIELKAAIELNSQEDTRTQCHFNVTAYNGIVLVSGEAPTQRLKEKIITMVRSISGVKLVHSQLIIAPPSSFSTRSIDTLTTAKIKSALSGVKNIPGFDATRIKVVTESGVVFLMGLVHRNEGYVTTELARREERVKKVVQIFEYID